MTVQAKPRIEPITQTDQQIAAALEDAHYPALLMALIHLTGDDSVLKTGPFPQYVAMDANLGGFTEQQKTAIRGQALQAIGSLRDNAGSLPPQPSAEIVRSMMDFVAGEAIPANYLPMFLDELSLADNVSDNTEQDNQAVVATELESALASADQAQDFSVVIIGAGMSGILAAIRLQQAGISFEIIEKNAGVGGTWLENSYPGCRVDTPNHLYSLSFEANDNWPEFYSTQSVLLEYFQQVADRHNLIEHIRFNSSVEQAVFDEAAQHWTVQINGADGPQTLTANAVISAVGQLNRPNFPAIKGVTDAQHTAFQGQSFHSAKWQHDCDLTGKRVAVIGTGASAFQFVPEIVDSVSSMTVFQRSAPWMFPTPDYHQSVGEGMKWLLRHIPYYEKWYRFYLYWVTTDGFLDGCRVDDQWQGHPHAVSEANNDIREATTAYIQSQISDPKLMDIAVPDYPLGGKRALRDNGVWFRALQQPHVEVVTEEIAEITAKGVRLGDGTEQEFDVIIYGTGFQPSNFLMPMTIKGKDGQDLHQLWDGDARAYLGMTVPGFPNFFCLYGPNTNIVVNGSIIFFSECSTRYIVEGIKYLQENQYQSMDCKQAIHDEFNAKLDAANEKMAWGVPEVKSWYKNAKGRVSQNWPYRLVEYWNQTQAPNPDDFDFS